MLRTNNVIPNLFRNLIMNKSMFNETLKQVQGDDQVNLDKIVREEKIR